MIREDFHIHSDFSDGLNTAEEMVLSAIAKGVRRMGFSEHGYAPYDLECCISREEINAYRDTVHSLAEKYRGQIEILCGIEQDIFSPEATDGFDYVIGSVHYLLLGGNYYSVDNDAGTLRWMAKEFFGGDYYALCEEYFSVVSHVVEDTDCDIIGHFDLVSKINEWEHLFDEKHPRYAAAWQHAADVLLRSGRPFEINTGAISRGYRTVPYPAPEMIAYIAQRGGTFILSSDSHRTDTLCSGFDVWEEQAKQWGARIVTLQLR